jgi:hypothetical protein
LRCYKPEYVDEKGQFSEAVDVEARERFFEALKHDPDMPRKVRCAMQKLAGKDFGESASE